MSSEQENPVLTRDYFHILARYNQWANRRLYDACGELSTEEYHRTRKAFFGSIHATLNHIMVGDLIWLGRFTGKIAPYTRLDQELYPSFQELRVHRDQLDERIIETIVEVDSQALGGVLRFHTISEPRSEVSSPMLYALGHFFNHQTHHRGQVHDMLSQTAVKPPALDLMFFVREIG